jgi:hypothetical protein
MRLGLLLLSFFGVVTPLRASPLKVTSVPERIVLGRHRTATVEVAGLPGAGPVEADVNVGVVTALRAQGDRVRISYTAPEQRSPQELCLLLRRKGGGERAVAARLPLWAYAVVPVKTRPNSQVTLTIADQVFGPSPSGRRGKLKLRVLVPPGVTSGLAVSVGDTGMRSTRKVDIRPADYNRLALAVSRRSGEPRSLHIIVATSSETAPTPMAMVLPPDNAGLGAVPVHLSARSPGMWYGTWSPEGDAVAGSWTFEVHLPGSPRSVRRATVELAPQPGPQPGPVVVKPATSPTSRPVSESRPWRFGVSLATGLMHNIGDLVCPRFTLEAGVSYALPIGVVGARLTVGVGWSGQDVPVGDGLSSTSTSLVLVPVGLLLSYRLPLGRLSPYAAAGPVALLVRTASEGEHTGARGSSHATAGALVLLGARLGLGPGGMFVQAGYQHGRFDERDAELLAGGLVVEAGYRLVLSL